MPAVPVSQEDADRMAAYETDVRLIFTTGTSGGTPVLPVQLTAAAYDGNIPDGTLGLTANFMKATFIAITRLLKNGPTKFPAQVPSYPKVSLPSAAANTGCLIFVTDDVGGSVPAFSDGAAWRRVTDRAVIA